MNYEKAIIESLGEEAGNEVIEKVATSNPEINELDHVNVSEDDIRIIPWQNPISSYIGDYWIQQKDEDPESVAKRREAYVEKLRGMLFDGQETEN